MHIMKRHLDVPTIPDLFLRVLPRQGSVELQHDEAGKTHDWHSHRADETLIILSGALLFEWDAGQQTCDAGDVIKLPSGTRHRSTATESGAIYLISLQMLEL